MNLPLEIVIPPRKYVTAVKERDSARPTSELMVTWTSFPAKPNTPRNYNVDTVNFEDTIAYRNDSEYAKERIVNGENQESESLESGYAPRYLAKRADQEPEVLGEFFRKVESLFHDVVHELVKLIVCTGTPIGLVSWIVPLRFFRICSL